MGKWVWLARVRARRGLGFGSGERAPELLCGVPILRLPSWGLHGDGTVSAGSFISSVRGKNTGSARVLGSDGSR